MKKIEKLESGEVEIVAFCRGYKGVKSAQIFGAVVNGAELFEMNESDTILIRGKFQIIKGEKIADIDNFRSSNSREYLLNNMTTILENIEKN
jgi:predicted nucleotidyltransferase